MQALLSVNPAQWEQEVASIREYFAEFGKRMPTELVDELNKISSTLQSKVA